MQKISEKTTFYPVDRVLDPETTFADGGAADTGGSGKNGCLMTNGPKKG